MTTADDGHELTEQEYRDWFDSLQQHEPEWARRPDVDRPGSSRAAAYQEARRLTPDQRIRHMRELEREWIGFVDRWRAGERRLVVWSEFIVASFDWDVFATGMRAAEWDERAEQQFAQVLAQAGIQDLDDLLLPDPDTEGGNDDGDG